MSSRWFRALGAGVMVVGANLVFPDDKWRAVGLIVAIFGTVMMILGIDE